MTTNDGPNLDLGSMLRQAQKMSEDLASRQAELAGRRYEGSAGGGVVTVTIVGGKVATIAIDPSVTDDAEMLADLITVAVNSALDAAAADSEKEMGELTGGLDLGGLLG
ncbi:MAG TPA: YbaB/EbfC family nucleoid-associated protein [Acidimicrobiia bacterium]|jgi:DNA-binding YbaB/EbfC family protein|nr:YbaB/EbfC family nucleoid-associated protein [Acidimicrobiia bacterium]